MALAEVQSAPRPVALPSVLYFLGYLSTTVPAVLYEASTPEAAVLTFGANGALTFGLYIGFFLALVSTAAYGMTLRAAFQYPFTMGRNIFSIVAGCFTARTFGLLVLIVPGAPIELVLWVVLAPSLLGRGMSSCWP